MKKLKILHTVEFYSPSVGGAQEVVRQLSEHMAALGHDVTVATSKLPNRKFSKLNGVKIKEFDIVGNKVRGLKGELNKYKQYLIRSNFDVVMNYAAQQWTSDLFFEVIDQIKAKKIFVPCGFSGLYDPAYKEYFKNLPAILAKYDKTVYLSHHYRDIDFARQHKLKNIVFIPNGADEREFDNLPRVTRHKLQQKYGIPANNKIILQVANHTNQKGHREAISAFIQAPIRDCSLVLIGDINTYAGCYNECLRQSKVNNYLTRYLRRDNKTIHVLHLSRRETLAMYSSAYMFLFLSNIECSPLVLFESAAAGLPFISSSAGNAQEISKWLGNGLIVPGTSNKAGYTHANIASASRLITKLVNNPKMVSTLGQKGLSSWQHKFTWSKITEQFIQIYS